MTNLFFNSVKKKDRQAGVVFNFLQTSVSFFVPLCMEPEVISNITVDNAYQLSKKKMHKKVK